MKIVEPTILSKVSNEVLDQNLSKVNKRFNPVKVLPKASHCQSEFKVHMV